IQKKRGRPKKPVWEHFTELTNNEARSNKKEQRAGAQCNYCEQKWARGKSSEMITHIALSCTKSPPEIRAKYISILRDGENDIEDEDDDLPLNKRQTKITDHMDQSTITSNKQTRCLKALTKFFVCCGIPFWI